MARLAVLLAAVEEALHSVAQAVQGSVERAAPALVLRAGAGGADAPVAASSEDPAAAGAFVAHDPLGPAAGLPPPGALDRA